MVLKDRVAVVTGGSSGIGRGVALEFAREGAACAMPGGWSALGAVARFLAPCLLLLAAAPAQADDATLWSGTLTPVTLSGQLGCTGINASFRCSNTSILSSDSFTYGGTTYRVHEVTLQENISVLNIELDRNFPSQKNKWTLHVGDDKFALSDASISGDQATWTSGVNLDWTAGTAVQLKLTTSNSGATGKPTISGTLARGAQLTASTSGISDPDGTSKAEAGDTGFAYTYEWIKVDGMDETVSGTGKTFTVPTASSTYKVKVSFKDDLGFDESRTSDAVEVLSDGTGLDEIRLRDAILSPLRKVAFTYAGESTKFEV